MKRNLERLVLLVLGLALMTSATGCYSTPEAGEIGVVRNGGPFDNKNIRQVVPNGAGNTWIGFSSEAHYYPIDTQQRFFKMQRGGDADAPPIQVPTSDGVQVGIEGTFFLNTTFNNNQGQALVKDFDTQFATRTFNDNGTEYHAYDGVAGWNAFLGSQIEPIVANNLRQVISNVRCSDLVSSCALVQNQGKSVKLDLTKQKNSQKITEIQTEVEKGLTEDLGATLRQPYFQNIRFILKNVDLPPKVQLAINDAQSAFAQISQAQARVQSAEADAKANEARQKGYSVCPQCARIDSIKAQADLVAAIPDGVHTFAPGQGFTLTGR